MSRLRSLVLPIAALAALSAASLWGPPSITVREVSGTPPTPGAVLELRTEHHTDIEKPDVTGRAIAQRGTERVTRPLTITASGTKGHYGVAKQWAAGTPWVLVFTVNQGDHGPLSSAESLVKVDAAGRILGIEPAMERNPRGGSFQRALTPAEIDAALASLQGGRGKEEGER